VSRFAYRAGWASRVVKPRRVGWGWVYVGPWVLGAVRRWDNAQPTGRSQAAIRAWRRGGGR
jgi:hypothetical protein